ncbi:MAG: sigma-70 family RNA polymerase sigma factor [Burkholderiaceae bacterium]
MNLNTASQATSNQPQGPQASRPPLSPAEFAEHRPAMLRFARRKIRDEDLAEDAVQEALAAAVASAASFQGQSAVKTWLIGILNHKIQDTFRREGRYVHLNGTDANDDDLMDLLSNQRDESTNDLGEDPASQVSRWRLGEALGNAIDDLPATLKHVFTLQVLEGQETGQVCETLGISEANCWVRLHRARKRLAEQMQPHLA